jgi:hypothetical protein
MTAKKCSDCGTIKAITKHHINGNGEGPTVPKCVICHMIINGTTEKGFARFYRKTERKYKKYLALHELICERLNPDGTFKS